MVCFLASVSLYDRRYWPGLGGLELLAGLALGVGVELPGLHRLLDRLVLVVVADLIQRQFALALRPACWSSVWARKLALTVSPTR